MIAAARLQAAVAQKLRSATGRRLAMSMGAAVATRIGFLALAMLIARSFGPADYGAFPLPPALRFWPHSLARWAGRR